MKQATYRVEAFIIPRGNEYCIDPVQTKSDNTKIKSNEANTVTVNIEDKESSCKQNEKNDLISVEKENMQNLENCIALEKLETNLVEKSKVNKYDTIHFYSSLDIPATKYKVLYDVSNGCFSPSALDKVCRLSTIDEKNEDSECKVTKTCYHGCENGCSATVPTPQEVTEEVFKENWLQRLEDIRQKEAILRSKEMSLHNRERILFKKEKEIKILERLLRDKLKQIDLRFEANKHLQELLKVHNLLKGDSESCFDTDTNKHKGTHTNDDSAKKLDNAGANKSDLCMQSLQVQNMFHNETIQIDTNANAVEITHKDVQQEKISVSTSSSSSSSSSCSFNNSVPERKRTRKSLNLKKSMSLKSSSKFTNDSNKVKPYKAPYEDLDTTLSADIGDSSFVQTSQKFNFELYRKPYAFTRSASERRGKLMNNGSDVNLEIQNLGNTREETPAVISTEQSKILKRVTENISASQDKSTKFQHYGLIDNNVDANKVCEIENEEKYSYLNLETNNRFCSHPKLHKGLKNRPMSWNEETNEWLQKKRKAYNMTMQKVVSEEIDNKENLKYSTNANKSEKALIKKDIKTKIRTMFR